MEGNITVQNVTKIRTGVWFISYTHECDCGCKTTRHSLTVEQKTKPSKAKAQELANGDYSTR